MLEELLENAGSLFEGKRGPKPTNEQQEERLGFINHPHFSQVSVDSVCSKQRPH